jgi:hypothetical protein
MMLRCTGRFVVITAVATAMATLMIGAGVSGGVSPHVVPVTNVTAIAPLGTALTGSTWAYTEDDATSLLQINSIVDDPVNNDGSLELETSDATGHVVAQTAASGDPSSLSGVSYQTFLVNTGGVASVSIQAGAFCNGTADSGFTTFVFEPYENAALQAVIPGEWQTWDASNGVWWSTHEFSATQGGGIVTTGTPGALGGQSDTQSLATLTSEFDNACSGDNPELVDIGVGMGSNNAGTQAWTDNLDYTTAAGSKDWNFEAPAVTGPGTATNVTTVAPLGTALTGATWAYTEDDPTSLLQINSIVNDPVNGDGSLELQTSDATGHVVAQTATSGDPSTLTNVSYQTFLVNGGNSANVSLQAGAFCNGTADTGFTTFVFEPYENTALQAQEPGEWQTWDASNGVWWSQPLKAAAS